MEPDTGASRLGSRRHRAPPLPTAPSSGQFAADEMAEDVDAEMEDVVALPPLPESNSALAVELLDGDRMDVRENSESPIPIAGPARASPGGYSEGDGEMEGGTDGSGHAGDAGIHGKRKR